jgi:hypothetical protein
MHPFGILLIMPALTGMLPHRRPAALTSRLAAG